VAPTFSEAMQTCFNRSLENLKKKEARKPGKMPNASKGCQSNCSLSLMAKITAKATP